MAQASLSALAPASLWLLLRSGSCFALPPPCSSPYGRTSCVLICSKQISQVLAGAPNFYCVFNSARRHKMPSVHDSIICTLDISNRPEADLHEIAYSCYCIKKADIKAAANRHTVAPCNLCYRSINCASRRRIRVKRPC
jgi:hypothetical protein